MSAFIFEKRYNQAFNRVRPVSRVGNNYKFFRRKIYSAFNRCTTRNSRLLALLYSLNKFNQSNQLNQHNNSFRPDLIPQLATRNPQLTISCPAAASPATFSIFGDKNPGGNQTELWQGFQTFGLGRTPEPFIIAGKKKVILHGCPNCKSRCQMDSIKTA